MQSPEKCPDAIQGVLQARAAKLYLNGDREGLKKLGETLTQEQANAVRSHINTVKKLRKASGSSKGEIK